MKNDFAALTDDQVEARLLAIAEERKKHRREILEAVAAAERSRVWEHLGFPSHQAYLEDRFGEWPLPEWEE